MCTKSIVPFFEQVYTLTSAECDFNTNYPFFLFNTTTSYYKYMRKMTQKKSLK